MKSTDGPISLFEGAIRVRDESLFGLDASEPCSRFLARAFEIAEVRSVSVDRVERTALIRHDAKPGGVPDLLGRLASAIRGLASPSAGPLPAIPSATTFSVHRFGATLTTWEVVHDHRGRLRLRHESLRGDPVVATRLERELRAVPGVRIVRASDYTGHLLIRYDDSRLTASFLVRLAEANLRGPGHRSSATPVRYGLANFSLGVAAVADYAVPLLGPASAALLIGTNLRNFREALREIRAKKVGLPVLYSAIVATTLLSGQFVASALMTWFFRFWHRRFRVELTTERSRLLEQARPEPAMARLLTPGGSEVLVEVGRLHAGDRVLVAIGEAVPADGRVCGGEGVVDERVVRGLEGISRKRTGDAVLAGASVLAGSLHVEVARLGEATRASAIRRALVAATNPAPGSSAPTARSEAFASRAVGPTLATAGVGLLAGDLLTAAAILRPDYATGPGLAVPLETLHNVALCARLGIVARDPVALEKLAEVDLVVLGDHPALARADLEVTRIDTRLPEPIFLRYAASTYRHLVDDRATALLAACRSRRVHALHLDPVDFGRGVTVATDKHRVRVSEVDPAAGPDGPLAVEVDGTVVGRVEFGRSGRLEAATAIGRIRTASHLPFAFVSPRDGSKVADLAGSLGVEMFRGGFSPDDTARFLAACRGRGIKAAFVGDCREQPRAAAEAHVAVSLVDEGDLDADPAGLLILRPRLDPLADLCEISRSHASRVIEAQRLILVPNLLCVAGAFLFGFTGMTAVMLSNLGTLGLYRRASDSLRGLETPGQAGTGRPRRAG